VSGLEQVRGGRDCWGWVKNKLRDLGSSTFHRDMEGGTPEGQEEGRGPEILQL